MQVTSPVEDSDWFDVSSLTVDQAPDAGDSVRVVTLSVSLLTRDGTRELATWSGLPVDPNHREGVALDSVFAKFANSPSSAEDARSLPLVIARDPLAVDSAFDVLHDLFGDDPTDLLVPNTEETRRQISPADKLTQGVWVDFQLTGGNDGQRPGATEYEGKADQNDGYSLGLKQFEDIEDISMVAAPGSTWDYANFRQDANGIIAQLIAHAERMRYRVALLDSGDKLPVAEVRGLRAKLDSKHAALYYPWVTVLDPITRREINLPPSGFVAGICARNDIERGVHKAPANLPVRGALGVSRIVSRAEQDVLNPAGVNCIRFFTREGVRVWGARTLAPSASEWRYLNVRRLFNMIEESIAISTRWVVFEPNDRPLWKSIKRDVDAFLTLLWRQGALAGASLEQAFFVRCDAETNPPDVVDAGQVVVLVGLAPMKPAEFVIFRIGQSAVGATVELA
jgi:hypothetical protein